MRNLKTVQRVILYAVIFPIGEREAKTVGYISCEAEAKKYAKLPLGWYGGTGTTNSKECDLNDLPKYHETAIDLAKQLMTFNDMVKYFNFR